MAAARLVELVTAPEAFFEALVRDGRAPAERWPLTDEPALYGLRTDGADLVPLARRDPLVREQILDALTQRARDWLERLDVHPVIGSTSAALMSRAERGTAAGHVCLAELQLAGRGRRGRSWFSPFGANLALSLGVRVHKPPAALGGASLVIGLGVLDALEELGVSGLMLKWPNDVLLGGDKLGGILIELARTPETELIVGIGLNVAIPPAIRAALPQPVADLSHLADPPRRSELAGRVISSVLEFVAGFEQQGFAPFREAFDARHEYHRRECRVLQGDRQVTGTVAGVNQEGELILDTPFGPRTFHGGEVSLRPPS